MPLRSANANIISGSILPSMCMCKSVFERLRMNDSNSDIPYRYTRLGLISLTNPYHASIPLSRGRPH